MINQNEDLAWKRTTPSRDNRDWKRILQEAKTVINRQHEHIVPLVACYQKSDIPGPVLHLFFPWAEIDMHRWMELDETPDFLRGPDEPLRRKEYLYRSVCSLVSAVAYLHREVDGSFTSHHDIKPANILLFGECWKICDFGKSRLRVLAEGSETEGQNGLGSRTYQPPEYLNKTVKGHGRSFDVWALGCIIVELAVLVVYGWKDRALITFAQSREVNQRQQSTTSEGHEDYTFANNLTVVHDWVHRMQREDGSRNLKDLMRIACDMLSVDREARPFAWEVELGLYDQFHPNANCTDRRTKIQNLVQTPKTGHKSDIHNPLARAVSRNDEICVECLYAAGWNLTQNKARSSECILENGKSNVISLLDDFRPSWHQVAQMFRENYEILREEYTKSEMRPLNEAVVARIAEKLLPLNLKFVEIGHILSLRYPVNLTNILISQEDGNKDLKDERGALFEAALQGDLACVRTLLQFGFESDIDLNWRGLQETPLMAASKVGHTAVVQRLLEEPNIRIDFEDTKQRTSLSYAAEGGHASIVRHLLIHGADPGVVDGEGQTPLSLAAAGKHQEVLGLIQRSVEMSRSFSPIPPGQTYI